MSNQRNYLSVYPLCPPKLQFGLRDGNAIFPFTILSNQPLSPLLCEAIYRLSLQHVGKMRNSQPCGMVSVLQPSTCRTHHCFGLRLLSIAVSESGCLLVKRHFIAFSLILIYHVGRSKKKTAHDSLAGKTENTEERVIESGTVQYNTANQALHFESIIIVWDTT